MTAAAATPPPAIPRDLAEAIRSRREIRVYVCAALGDLQAERDELLGTVLPRLRQRCEHHGVTLTEVDPRRGLADPDAADRRALDVGLTAIDDCRPLFVAVLGDRYGWVPPELPAALLAAHPWLADHSDASVTELELRHGALRGLPGGGGALLYARAPRAARPASPLEPSGRQAALDRLAIVDLKHEARAGAVHMREGFTSPAELGAWVEADLAALIKPLLPEHLPSPQARENAEHDALAARLGGSLVGADELLAHVDATMRGHAGPLLIHGALGSGTSALLAAWVARSRRQDPDRPVLVHLAAATPEAADWRACVHRLGTELAAIAGFTFPEAGAVVEARLAFLETLERAARRRPFAVVLDGLDLLQGPEGGRELAWLPTRLPLGVTLLMSCATASAPARVAAARGWAALELGPLTPERRRELAAAVLEADGPAPEPALLAQVLDHPAAGNPLFLTILCGALGPARASGKAERLDSLLGAWSLTELGEAFLDGLEADLGAEAPLARAAFRLLVAAQRGLTEPELVETLDAVGVCPPRAAVTALLHAARPLLERRAGRLVPAHPELREVLRQRYLTEPDTARSAHAQLAAFFSTRPHGVRRADELPHHLAAAGAWRELSCYLADPDVLADHLAGGPYGLQPLLAGAPPEVAAGLVTGVEALLASHRQAGEKAEMLAAAAALLVACCRPADAERFLRRGLGLAEIALGEDDPRTVAIERTLAASLVDRGALTEAEPVYRHALAALRPTAGAERPPVADILDRLSEIRRLRGDLVDAEDLGRRALEIRQRQLGPDQESTARSLHHLGLVLAGKGDPIGGEALLMQARTIRETGPAADPVEAAATLDAIGCVQHARHDELAARATLDGALQTRVRLLGSEHPDTLETACNLLAVEVALLRDSHDHGAIDVLLGGALAPLLQTDPASLDGRRRRLRQLVDDTLRELARPA